MRKFWQKKYVSKYTGKEIDDAVAKAGTALQNPMTAAGDMIVGGTDGAAGKLAKGTDGKVLKMVSGAPVWADDSAGMVNPMTTAGDVIIGGTDGAPDRLAKGTDGQVLSMVSGAPAWAAVAAGGSKIYKHTISVPEGTGSTLSSVIAFSTSDTPITSGSNLVYYTNNIFFIYTMAKFVLMRKFNTSESKYEYYGIDENGATLIGTIASASTLTDVVTQL